MSPKYVYGLTVVAILLCPMVARSQDLEAVRKKAAAMREEAEDLTKKGFVQEAEKLQREAARLIDLVAKKESGEQAVPKEGAVAAKIAAEAEKVKAQIENMKEVLAAMRKKEAPEDAIADQEAAIRKASERLHTVLEYKERHANGSLRKQPLERKGMEELEHAMHRIRHLQMAIPHLLEAGLPELAEKLKVEAGNIERHAQELRTAMEAAAREQNAKGGKHGEPGHRPEAAANEAMKHEIERLRAEVRELRELLERSRKP